MIGIGKWEGEIITPFFYGKGQLEIREKDGKYDFVFDLPDKYKNMKIYYREIREIGTDALFVRAEADMFPGKVLQIRLTFEDNRVYGFIRLPVMGGYTVQIKNGRRISQAPLQN